MFYSWNPWHGCKRISSGCKNCFVCFLDKKRGVLPEAIYKVKTKFTYPIQKDRLGKYKIPSHTQVTTCLTSDFFIEEADEWRWETWKMIKERQDIEFLIPTKRIHRLKETIPADWNNGYDNVFICVSVENQEMADLRIPLLLDMPIKKRGIFLSPILEDINISNYLETRKIDYVSVGGESYLNARECHFEWVVHIKEQCEKYQVEFNFHQTGSNFIKDGIHYSIPHHKEYEQAKKAFLTKK